MKKQMALFLAATLALWCLWAPALAQSASVTGTVVNVGTETVTVPAGGTVKAVLVSAGDRVRAGDPILTLDAVKVYANESGILRVFGQIGDSAETVAARYGAVAYIEPDAAYTISANTRYAYNQEENKILHPGESVYLRSNEELRRVGLGVVTAPGDGSFTVEITEGEFNTGESVNVFRSEDYGAISRIGRGAVAHTAPIAYAGEGLIAAFPVSSGTHVEKGDVIFEILEGTYQGNSGDLTAVAAPKDGVILSVSVNVGAAIASGAAAAELYPDAGLRLEALVSESDLGTFAPGSPVRIEFPYVENGEYALGGRVEKVSLVGGENSAEAESEEAWFTVTVLPDSTAGLSYGMHAIISALDGE